MKINIVDMFGLKVQESKEVAAALLQAWSPEKTEYNRKQAIQGILNGVSLGYQIIGDALVCGIPNTTKIAVINNKRIAVVDVTQLSTSVVLAMCHDISVIPWNKVTPLLKLVYKKEGVDASAEEQQEKHMSLEDALKQALSAYKQNLREEVDAGDEEEEEEEEENGDSDEQPAEEEVEKASLSKEQRVVAALAAAIVDAMSK